jgi:photosystem II stability/assembly factor-like uncharacterized protein
MWLPDYPVASARHWIAVWGLWRAPASRGKVHRKFVSKDVRKVSPGGLGRPVAALAVFAALVCAPAGAEDGQWTKLPTAPYVLNNKQDALVFAGSGTGWYGNGTGSVYRTTDFGEHWRPVWKSHGTYVRALEFIDEKTGYLGNVGPGYFPNVTDKQALYTTIDGGEHWLPVTPTAGPQIVGVCAIDILKVDGKVLAVRAGGRVGGPAGMLEFFDEGRNFQARDMRSVTGMILDIHFVDANVGFIAGASEAQEEKAHARILKTTDAGKTWRAVFDSERPGDNNWKLAFPSASVGYGTIISYQAPEGEARCYVVKTVDGGEHWRRITVTDDAQWMPYGINFLDGTHGWVGGRRAASRPATEDNPGSRPISACRPTRSDLRRVRTRSRCSRLGRVSIGSISRLRLRPSPDAYAVDPTR